MKEKVVIGMSGGVDSSVAAYLLLKKGYDVIGIMLQVSPKDVEFTEREGGCCQLSDVEDARRVAFKLGIPFYVFNMRENFKEKVIDNFIDEYLNGRTPNPCIMCNKHIKFEDLLARSLGIGASFIATGHYSKIENKDGRYLLKRACDDHKDQSYVLYNLTQDQLKHTLMPCGDYTKGQIRQIADELGLEVAKKPDSEEICFVLDDDHGNFIKSVVPERVVPGNFVDKNGKILGKHKGIVYYTIGQRKGLGIATGKRIFVVDINPLTNEVVLGDESDIFKSSLIIKDVNFIALDSLKEPMEVQGKIRYSSKLAAATIYPLDDERIKVVFNKPQRAITKGQSCVLYDGDLVVGGGVIV